MYNTYVVRPGELPPGRAPQCQPLWDGLLNMSLRLGLFLQFTAFIALNCISIICGRGLGFSGFVSNSETRLPSSFFAFLALLACLQYLLGACLVNGFRTIGDDEGSIKYTRGYRCGVKFLSYATLLDICQAGLTALYFFSQLNYYDDAWQVDNVKPNPMTIYTLFGRVLHAASLFAYAAAFFYMEAYHSVGTAELWGWGIATIFKVASCLLLLVLTANSAVADLLFTLALGFALLCSCVWAQTFEGLIVSKEVDLDQSALRNEWYKSRNAMAYYGPPIEEGMQMIKE